jgi:hypothetical protein
MNDFYQTMLTIPAQESRSCNCVGPRNGDPVCPCMMPEHNRRKMADMALDILMRMGTKPRIRVKAR